MFGGSMLVVCSVVAIIQYAPQHAEMVMGIEACCLSLVFCFSVVWCCWGLVMFCAGGWTHFSKYYWILMGLQCAVTCCVQCIQHAGAMMCPSDDQKAMQDLMAVQQPMAMQGGYRNAYAPGPYE